ncbi:MAG: DUF5685 family protein [Oscillospiraceae bacterium]
MFGYVIANLEGLTQPQKDRYKGCYCGLCRVLKQRHGFSGRLTLTYDMTFLVLLLSALYEADEERGMELCPAHPAAQAFLLAGRATRTTPPT